ncbi:recombinase family protein [Mycobacterium heckeshornense]|uniref:recombinase family protein n=1 Tax=Mycobacterium heckeshornense TaxID=110505 RepID=UPI001F356263|nr:recombinase family protein [Mycobacterium heckeshornense]
MQRQLDDCVALADRLGWEVVARFDDNDVSAFNGKRRPGFEAMLAGMAAGEFGGLLVWHTDRLYRSMRDLERLIDVAESKRVQIRTVQGGDLDLSTSAGRMIARILGSVARQESEHMAERRRRANAQKAETGMWQTANRPLGYTVNGEPLEPEASMIRQAAADVLAGKSIKQVAREWNATGLTGTRGRKFTGPNVRRLLVNPRYAGLRVHQGKVIGPGNWEPLIDEQTHRGLVAYLSDPSRIICTSFEKKYIGSGIYRCGVCGGRMRHSVSGGPRAGGRRYECRDRQCVVRTGPPLDAYVEAVVLAYLRRTDIHVLLDGNKVDVGALQTQRSALQARLDDLAAMFAEGVIDASQLRRGTSELRTQLASVDNQLAELTRRSPVADLLTASDALEKRWAALSPDMKGKVIDELVTVVVHKAPPGSRFNPDYIDIQPKRK